MYKAQFPVLTFTFQKPALVNIIVTDRWGALGGIWTVPRAWSKL